MSDAQVPSFDIDDVAVEFYHVVVVVKVDVYLMDLTVKASEFLNETRRGEDEESCTAHQHERGHDKMCGKEEYHSKDVFEYAMLEPAETKSFREEDMLKVPHIACREEKKFIIHPEEMVFFCPWSFSPGEPVEYGVYLRGTVYFGDHVE